MVRLLNGTIDPWFRPASWLIFATRVRMHLILADGRSDESVDAQITNGSR